MGFPFKDSLFNAVVKLPRLYNSYDEFVGYCLLFRLDKRVTKVIGPKYRTNKEILQVDITYDCNLRCPACCRSCSQAPSKDYMTVGQIDHLIQESIRLHKKWRQIKIMGGEPTLHPDFMEILDTLRNYRDESSPNTSIAVLTNRSKRCIVEIYGKTYDDVEYVTSQKDMHFIQSNYHPFNLAPRDFSRLDLLDYANGCLIPQKCGIGLNRYGYYICGNGGGIDRIFGFDVGRKSIPRADDQMRDQMRLLCSYCGEFHNYFTKISTGINYKFGCSKTWKNAYEKYRKQKPTLTLYQ